MLRSLVECQLRANFLIIQDTEDVGGQDLFIAFLKNCERDGSVKEIRLICFENPPVFYFPSKEIGHEKVVVHDFFNDPCGWNNPSTPKQDLSMFTSDRKNLSETAVFIDSLSFLAYHQGFFAMCRDLSILRERSRNILCAVHGDLFRPEQLEELSFFASAYIKLQNFSSENNCKERTCEVTYKKPGGKIIKQVELFLVSDDFKVSSRITEPKKPVVVSGMKDDIENLSTFKLGLHISDKEKKARDELVLPYLKSEVSSKMGEIIYQPDDFEDDPDDDLDI